LAGRHQAAQRGRFRSVVGAFLAATDAGCQFRHIFTHDAAWGYGLPFHLRLLDGFVIGRDHLEDFRSKCRADNVRVESNFALVTVHHDPHLVHFDAIGFEEGQSALRGLQSRQFVGGHQQQLVADPGHGKIPVVITVTAIGDHRFISPLGVIEDARRILQLIDAVHHVLGRKQHVDTLVDVHHLLPKVAIKRVLARNHIYKTVRGLQFQQK
jgi:hypothetical protein